MPDSKKEKVEERLLTRVRQNEVFAIVQHVGLDPADFRWEKVEQDKTYGISASQLVSQLVHVPTQFYFTFSLSGEYFTSQWWPPEDYGAKKLSLEKSWHGQKDCVRNWLYLVNTESKAPDLWGAALADRTLASAAANQQNNDQFTSTEISNIEKKLDEICAYIQETHTTDDAAKETVAHRVGYLKSAARRLGRMDWSGIVVSSLVSMAIEGVYSSTALADVMRFAGTALQSVIHTASRLL